MDYLDFMAIVKDEVFCDLDKSNIMALSHHAYRKVLLIFFCLFFLKWYL